MALIFAASDLFALTLSRHSLAGAFRCSSSPDIAALAAACTCRISYALNIPSPAAHSGAQHMVLQRAAAACRLLAASAPQASARSGWTRYAALLSGACYIPAGRGGALAASGAAACCAQRSCWCWLDISARGRNRTHRRDLFRAADGICCGIT